MYGGKNGHYCDDRKRTETYNTRARSEFHQSAIRVCGYSVALCSSSRDRTKVQRRFRSAYLMYIVSSHVYSCTAATDRSRKINCCIMQFRVWWCKSYYAVRRVRAAIIIIYSMVYVYAARYSRREFVFFVFGLLIKNEISGPPRKRVKKTDRTIVNNYNILNYDIEITLHSKPRVCRTDEHRQYNIEMHSPLFGTAAAAGVYIILCARQ